MDCSSTDFRSISTKSAHGFAGAGPLPGTYGAFWRRLSDHAKAQRLLENLAKKYDDICPGAAWSVRKGMLEMLTLTRLVLPYDLRKSLALTNIMESVNSMIARASRNVMRWRNASMACDGPPRAC